MKAKQAVNSTVGCSPKKRCVRSRERTATAELVQGLHPTANGLSNPSQRGLTMSRSFESSVSMSRSGRSTLRTGQVVKLGSGCGLPHPQYKVMIKSNIVRMVTPMMQTCLESVGLSKYPSVFGGVCTVLGDCRRPRPLRFGSE